MPRPGPSLSGVLTATGSNVCKFSRVFDHVKPPKNARIVDKKKEKKKNPNENNRALRLSGLGPNNKQHRYNRVLAPSVLGCVGFSDVFSSQRNAGLLCKSAM